MTSLIRYEAARAALAEARSVDEVKDIHDKSEAIRAYAKIAKNRELEVDALELRLRASRRLGQMLDSATQSGDLTKGGRPPQFKTKIKATLRDIGISKRLSSESKQLAHMEDPRFDSMLGRWRQESLSTTTTRVKIPTARPTVKKPRRPQEFEIEGGDVRRFTIGYLRRVSGILSRVLNVVANSDDDQVVGDCVSDAVLLRRIKGTKE